MNDPLPEIDEERAALIDRRLEQSFRFLADVLENSMRLDEIPGGSKLAFHTLSMPNGEMVRLTAFRPHQSRRWQMRVTGVAHPDQKDQAWGREQPLLWQLQPLIESASWESAAVAFAALEETVRRRTGERHQAG